MLPIGSPVGVACSDASYWLASGRSLLRGFLLVPQWEGLAVRFLIGSPVGGTCSEASYWLSSQK